MVLSKRERYAGMIAIAILAVLVFDKLIFTPLIERRQLLAEQLKTASDDLERVNRLISTSERAGKLWSAMDRGALSRDESAAESRILNNVREWAQESGMTLSSMKPERSEKEKEFFKITFRATGTGQMSQIGRFLHRVQTSTIPVRITDLTLNARKEGSDDLTASIGIATIYLAPEPDKSRLGATASIAGVSR